MLKRLFQRLIDKPEIIFLVFGVLFGILFMVLTPPFEVPDEAGHLHRAVETANGVFYNKIPAGVSAYDNYFSQSQRFGNEFQSVGEKFHFQSGYNPVMYLASAAGVKLGAAFQSPVLMFYLARIFNLVVWLVLIYSAIKITPIFKWMFLFAALLPMSVFEGMSLSADSFVNSFSFLFFAFCFRLIFPVKEKITASEAGIYYLMTLISSLLKGCLIYPAFLIFFVRDKRKWIYGISAIILAVIAGFLWVSHNYTAVGPDGNPVAAKAFLCAHPFLFFEKVIRTVFISSFFWLKGAVGILGWLDVKRFPVWFYLMTLAVFISGLLFIPEKFKINLKMRVLAFILICLYTGMILTALFITWNPVDVYKIGGVQGRYFIALLPLFFILFSPNYKLSIDNLKFKCFLIAYIFFMLIMSSVLLINIY